MYVHMYNIYTIKLLCDPIRDYQIFLNNSRLRRTRLRCAIFIFACFSSVSRAMNNDFSNRIVASKREEKMGGRGEKGDAITFKVFSRNERGVIHDS